MEIPKTVIDDAVSELYELIDWLEPLRKPNIVSPSTHVQMCENRIRAIAGTLLYWSKR